MLDFYYEIYVNSWKDFSKYYKTMRMQLDSAPAHFSIDVRNFLNRKFLKKWIGKQGPDAFLEQSPISVQQICFYKTM